MKIVVAAIFGMFVLPAALAQVTTTAHINNAPAWVASHTYSPPQEVKTAGGVGVTGTRGYKLISGACTSGSSGGPSGTGSSISDGTCTWKYLSDIDYTSISLWLQNGIPSVVQVPAWQTSTAYAKYDVVYTTNTSPGQAYYAANAGTSCAAPATGPSGSRGTSADCGVTWKWLRALRFPLTRRNSGISLLKGTYIAEIYNGGEYLNDGNTMTDPSWHSYGNPGIWIGYHNQPRCRGECFPLNFSLPTVQTSRIILTAAPGESIVDTSANPLKYDPSKGVAIRCSTVSRSFNNSCLQISDWNVFVNRIQIRTPYNGVSFFSHGALSNDLIDADGDAVWLDSMATVSNSVIYSGNIGVGMKYHDTLINNTIFGKAGAVIGLYQVYHPSYNGAPVISNNAIMGFKYCAAYSPRNLRRDAPGFETAAPASDYNATDVGSGGKQNGFAGITWTSHNRQNSGQPATSMPCPGMHSLFNVPFTTANFVDVTSGSYNAKLSAGSSLIGSGALANDVISTFSTSGAAWPDSAILRMTTNCSPAPHPYGDNSIIEWCSNPLATVAGTGIPAGTSLIAMSGGKGRGALSMTDGCSGCSSPQTITLNFSGIQSSDIFGTSRSSHMDIGAVQGSTDAPE